MKPFKNLRTVNDSCDEENRIAQHRSDIQTMISSDFLEDNIKQVKEMPTRKA